MDSRVSITPCHHLRTTCNSKPGNLLVPRREERCLDILGGDGGVAGAPCPWRVVKEQSQLEMSRRDTRWAQRPWHRGKAVLGAKEGPKISTAAKLKPPPSETSGLTMKVRGYQAGRPGVAKQGNGQVSDILSLLSGRRKQTSDIFSFSIQI